MNHLTYQYNTTVPSFDAGDMPDELSVSQVRGILLEAGANVVIGWSLSANIVNRKYIHPIS